jgi:hypothetical protein
MLIAESQTRERTNNLLDASYAARAAQVSTEDFREFTTSLRRQLKK